jgi:zinc protease
MRFAPMALTVLAAALTAAAVLGPAGPAAAAPNLIRTLPNKMTVIVRENRSRPLATVQVWIDAGSRDESRSERGAASALSYLPYEETSTRKRGDVRKEAESFGGTLGSESGYTNIIYNMTVPARYVNRALDILSDAVLHPSFNQYPLEQSVAKARGESRGALSAAGGVSLNALRESLYGDTPPGTPLHAPELEVAALTLPIVQRYYKENFVADRITVVVVGDVEAEPVADQIAAAFKDVPAGKSRPHPRVQAPKELKDPIVRAVPSPPDADGSVVAAGFRAPLWGTADATALDVLLAVLVDAPGSRLERRLREGGNDFGAAAAQRSFGPDPGFVALVLSADPGRMADAEGILAQEIEKVRSQPVTAEECQAAIHSILARELMSRSELWGLGRATALAYYQGHPGADEVYAQRVSAVRPEDLSGVARKYLDWKNGAVVEMMPARTADSLGTAKDFPKRFQEKLSLFQGTYRSGPLATASTDEARRARIDGPLASIASTPFDAGRGRVERSRLAGGIRLLTGPDHSAPGVTVAVYLNGGVRWENDKNNGITSLVRETLLKSNDPKRNGRASRQSLSLLGSFTPYQDRDMWGVSLAVPSSDWKEALNRLGAMMSHPDLDSVTVDATRILLLTALDKWLDDDAAQRQRLIFATKYAVSGYRLPGVGNKVNLISLPTSAIGAYYRKFVVKPNLYVAVFGDVNPSEVGPAVEEAFRDVSAGPFHPGEPPVDLPFPGFREKWELGAGSMTTIQLAFNGPPADSPEMPVFYVVNSLLSGPYGWFQKYVMAEPTAQSANSIVAQAIDESPIIASLTIGGPIQEVAMVKLLFRQFKKVAGMELIGPDLDQDLRNAKTHAIGTFYATFTTNTSRAFQWARADLFGLPPDALLALPSKMDAVTPGDLLRVGTRYFQRGDWEKAPYAIAETRPGGW